MVAVFPEKIVPADGVSATKMPPLATGLLLASTTCTFTAGEMLFPTTTFVGCTANANLFADPAFTVIDVVVAAVTVPCVVSVTVIVYGEPAVELICRGPKAATPLEAAREVVPAAKLPELRATESVSFEPVLPVVIVLPNVSSIVTPTLTVPPR